MTGAGYLLKVPAIDLAEVGAGGGSIIWIDAGGFKIIQNRDCLVNILTLPSSTPSLIRLIHNCRRRSEFMTEMRAEESEELEAIHIPSDDEGGLEEQTLPSEIPL